MTGPFGDLLVGSTEVLIDSKMWVVGRLRKATHYRLLIRDFYTNYRLLIRDFYLLLL